MLLRHPTTRKSLCSPALLLLLTLPAFLNAQTQTPPPAPTQSQPATTTDKPACPDQFSFRACIRRARLYGVVLFMLAAMLGCRTPSSDWNGTWKLNAAKSSLQGPLITISISADGEYRYSDGLVSTTFRCDGKYRPIGNDRTQACVKSSAMTLDRTRMENGVKTNTYHWELSSDGKILTATATALNPSGPVIMGRLVAARVSGFNDFSGEWRDTNFLQRRAQMKLRIDSRYLHLGYPSAGEYVDAPLDGADAEMKGPGALVGTTYSVLAGGRRELLMLGKRDGKSFTQDLLKLSDDRRVIIDTWVNPAQTTDKGTLVYEREE